MADVQNPATSQREAQVVRDVPHADEKRKAGAAGFGGFREVSSSRPPKPIEHDGTVVAAGVRGRDIGKIK